MKYIFLCVLLFSCKSEEKKECPKLIDAIIKSAAVKFAKYQECDEAAVVKLFQSVEGKMLSCDPSIQYSGLGVKDIACNVVPDLASVLVEFDPLELGCDLAVSSVYATLKEVMGCD